MSGGLAELGESPLVIRTTDQGRPVNARGLPGCDVEHTKRTARMVAPRSTQNGIAVFGKWCIRPIACCLGKRRELERWDVPRELKKNRTVRQQEVSVSEYRHGLFKSTGGGQNTIPKRKSPRAWLYTP